MCQNTCDEEAPSTVAASVSSRGIASNPAMKKSAVYPTFDHTTTKAAAGRAHVGETRISSRVPASAERRPPVGAKIHDHTTPRASGGAIQGMTMSVR